METTKRFLRQRLEIKYLLGKNEHRRVGGLHYQKAQIRTRIHYVFHCPGQRKERAGMQLPLRGYKERSQETDTKLIRSTFALDSLNKLEITCVQKKIRALTFSPPIVGSSRSRLNVQTDKVQ